MFGVFLLKLSRNTIIDSKRIIIDPRGRVSNKNPGLQPGIFVIL